MKIGKGETVLSAIILLGGILVPFFLVAAMIRGGCRAQQKRAALRRQIKGFE